MPKAKSFYKRKANEALKIAKERIKILFGLAKEEFASGRKDLANRYVFLANKLAMKVNLPMPAMYRRQYCKKCNHYLQSGVNASIRLNSSRKMIELKCFDCSYVRRWGYTSKKKLTFPLPL